MKKNQPKPVNMLRDIYLHFVNAPLVLREKICEECNMSVPTFYRKMRPEIGQQKRQSLSNAEREGILRTATQLLKNLEDFLCKYRGDPDHGLS